MKLKIIGREIKALFGLVFLAGIPACIFLSPIFFSFYTCNFWYMLLFVITWFPAIIVGKFVATLIK